METSIYRMNRSIYLLIVILLFGFSSIDVNAQIKDIKLSYEDGMYAEMKTTRGLIVLQLHYDKVPMTVANFVSLCEGTMPNNCVPAGKCYYAGNKFHRVIKNFMIQGGAPQSCPTNKELKPVGYKFKDEFHPDLKHTGPGVLSMANAGPGTNSAQFFITHVKTPWLDNKHSVFGKVLLGQSVVNKIKQGDKIESIKIVRVGKLANDFDAPAVFKEKSKE